MFKAQLLGISGNMILTPNWKQIQHKGKLNL